MKKIFAMCAFVGMASACLTPNLYASLYGGTGTLTLNQGSQSFGNGGVFYADATGLGSFQTFCVELNEEFSPGGTYYYQINSGAVADSGDITGYGHIDTTDTLTGPGTGLNQDNICIGTAWLYSQFRAGTLVGYDPNNNATAGALQNAIWYLEGEINLSQLTYNSASATLAQQFLNEAATATGTTLTDSDPTGPSTDTPTGVNGKTGTIFEDSNGAYDVVVLNLYDSSGGGLVQDQLAIVPEPTTLISGALLLLPFGASTLRIVRKNRAA
jgi:hypothetical protein